MGTKHAQEEEKVTVAIASAIPKCGDNPGEAINSNFEIPVGVIVKRTNTSTGARISTVIKQECSDEPDEAETLKGSKPQTLVKEIEVPDRQEASEESDEAEAVHESNPQSLVKNEVSDSQEGLVQEVEMEPVLNRVKEEPFEESDESKSLMLVQSQVPDTQEGLVQEVEPDLNLVKEEPFRESDESKSLMLVPSQVPDSQEGLVLQVEPITTLVKLEVSGELDYAETLDQEKIESQAKKEEVSAAVQEGLAQQEENVKKIRSVMGSEIPEADILQALLQCGNNPDAAINYILENQTMMVKRTSTSTGARISTQLRQEGKEIPNSLVKKEVPDCELTLVKQIRPNNLEDGDFPTERDWLMVGRTFVTALSTSKGRKLVDNEVVHFSFPKANSSNKTKWIVRFSTKRFGEIGRLPMEWSKCVIPLINSGKVKVLGRCIAAPNVLSMMQEVVLYVSFYIHQSIFTEGDHSSWRLDASPNIDSSIYPLLTLFKLLKIQPYKKAEFTPEELDSRKRLLNIEGRMDSSQSNTLNASISTPSIPPETRPQPQTQPDDQVDSENVGGKRSLRSVVWLHCKKIVKRDDMGEEQVRGVCNYCKKEMLAHSTKHGTTGLKNHLEKRCKLSPLYMAEFTPKEHDSQKHLLNIERIPDEAAVLPIVKRRKGCQQPSEESKDEQVITESSLNKIVGAADVYDLEEMEPPSTLTCVLKPYQKQALYWMSELEKGIDVEKAAQTLHPCWGAYHICDERASSIYVNIFTGEATTKFPTATQMARGGILADAMGLGKTVMTIALILARPGRRSPDSIEVTKKRRIESDTSTPLKPRGGTLVVCPMSLLSQWKDELETHSESESISIFVHYGGCRTTNPNALSVQDVVLTTYGVLAASYKSDGENSIFHQVDWYRVVLDEAHTIKSSRTQGAQAAFALSSHCRWCLTGTPLQNNLEDLYSLLCFLHVEPWCNWAWWCKLIQRPYESGDPRGLRLIKAILRPLMLRRTKETKDKQGRAILDLPPTDIQTIECEQSEAEHYFYEALFRKSKVQFDQFVAQGKVLHNYANILELLLRLRQCCNHPYLVMSRADSQKIKGRSHSQKIADLDEVARKFLENNSSTSKQIVPTQAYVEEVVDSIRRGENKECPICLEFADDPVLTPCAHKMCRECLLSSWQTPASGRCPICRQWLANSDLIACPSESPFQVSAEENWTESSKISKLLDCLEHIRRSTFGAKSIVFSQWTSFLDLLETPMKNRGIGFVRFDGSLSQTQRERVLYEFNETREKMVLLTSLKTGGVGLNLTAASNVFIMDPWWNPAVEEQAIMRIHRIGQKRTVVVRRFIVKDTVEERMQQVQARKQRMIAGALTDEEVRSARIEELKMLFT